MISFAGDDNAIFFFNEEDDDADYLAECIDFGRAALVELLHDSFLVVQAKNYPLIQM